MPNLIIAAIGVIIALGAFITSISSAKQRKDDALITPTELRIISAVSFAVAVLALGIGSVYTQDPGQAMVIRSFTGKVIGKDTSPGMGFTAPWNSTIEFDVRNQVVSYAGDGAE